VREIVLNLFLAIHFLVFFDGHGGAEAAQYCKEHMHLNLIQNPNIPEDPRKAMEEMFKQTDCEFGKTASKHAQDSGATVVTVLVQKSLRNRYTVFVANVGDSAAVLCRSGKAILLSTPHKPDMKEERERIEKAGGTVVFYGTWRVNSALAVSRAIGDHIMKELIISDPAVYDFEITEDDEFIILASDGLWDVFSVQDAVNHVRRSLVGKGGVPSQDVCNSLLNRALEKKTQDNTSIIIVFFK